MRLQLKTRVLDVIISTSLVDRRRHCNFLFQTCQQISERPDRHRFFYQDVEHVVAESEILAYPANSL
jgi:hypothetical protein